ncbi:sigma factor [Nonomuraea sp. 10N515B]|uniref:sigma factor n=1 Tax=Nonomuraea sp. 10N515B TaxID=3457422 RepID=UPI003FCE339F
MITPHRRALHLRCYRMLGSIDQAEEVVQETLLRAWRGLGGYADRAPLHHWLHKIATMALLQAAERRERLPRPLVLTGAALVAGIVPRWVMAGLTGPDRWSAHIPRRQASPRRYR